MGLCLVAGVLLAGVLFPPEPRTACVGAGPPRLCGTGNLYGGTAPAHTWFDAMTEIHTGLPVTPLPPVAEGFRAKPGDR
ncbi:hypothetical protein CKY47_22750 [Saccharothrix yanglingensis]|uniref:Uncharacterized protein n=1 Tax=Saccharothrix yanglingensis TaxID=659496 RepID=A0ABU0X423_9PSEU|nr:hypothetical protein [Saccharothrix yanglingensis]